MYEDLPTMLEKSANYAVDAVSVVGCATLGIGVLGAFVAHTTYKSAQEAFFSTKPSPSPDEPPLPASRSLQMLYAIELRGLEAEPPRSITRQLSHEALHPFEPMAKIALVGSLISRMMPGSDAHE